jgi:putative addiction module antidote
MVELKVRRFGNSLGVVLPKEVISRLQTSDGAPLFLIEASDGGYRLTPYDPAFEKKMTKAADIISRYRNTLHVLAK